MLKKLKIILPLALCVWIVSAFLSMKVFLILTIAGIIGCIYIGKRALFVILNKLIRNTNWYKNQYLYIRQFVSNEGYRDNIIRNYDVVNLGSNPAVFGFFYEGIKGQSWATGSQGLDMDFEILKYFHCYLKKGGTVIIPIMPFTAISPYIKTKRGYWDARYYSKFYKILDYAQREKLPDVDQIVNYIHHPFTYQHSSWRYIIRDVAPDTRYTITEQPMMSMALMQDAELWMKIWYNEFDIKNINEVCDSRWDKWIDEASSLITEMIDYCLERDLRPVLVYLPFTKYLSEKFTAQSKKRLVYDFVNRIDRCCVDFLDYSTDEELKDEKLYYNSFFLNLNGRKKFTDKVLTDLRLK